MRPATPDRLLEIYLADHLAASTAGVALARRSAERNAGTSLGEVLSRLATEIAEDRLTLQGSFSTLAFGNRSRRTLWRGSVRRLAVEAERADPGYSPLSRVLELETLSVGVVGARPLGVTPVGARPQ